MAYLISEEAQDLLQDVKNFCDKEVVEQCKEYDVSGEWPKAIYEKAIEQGYQALEVPEEYGGPGGCDLDRVLAIREIGKVDGSLATLLSVSSMMIHALEEFGTEEQKNKYFPLLAEQGYITAFALTEPGAGSDPSAMKSTAKLDEATGEYVINGNKTFITGGARADVIVIFVMTSPEKGTKGISAFILEKGMKGLSYGTPENKMGICASETVDLFFDDLRVPKENLLGKADEGFKIAMKILDGSRIGIGAVALGIAEGAFEEAVKYSKERKQFGKPICANQGIQWYIAEMATSIETARMLLFEAATLREQGKPYSKQAAMSKLYCSKVAREVTNLALQIHGGYGYMKEYTVERLYRDAKITEIYEGTSEIQKIVIAKQVLAEFK